MPKIVDASILEKRQETIGSEWGGGFLSVRTVRCGDDQY